MYFDIDNKELLAKYPRGFNLYYNVILRMLNPDRSSWQFLDLSDDKIDIIRGKWLMTSKSAKYNKDSGFIK